MTKEMWKVFLRAHKLCLTLKLERFRVKLPENSKISSS